MTEPPPLPPARPIAPPAGLPGLRPPAVGIAGGTSVGEEPGGRRWMIAVAALGLVAGALVVAGVVAGGGGAPEQGAEVPATPAPAAAARPLSRRSAPGAVAAPALGHLSSRDDRRQQAMEAAATMLGKELDRQQLWSQVDVDPNADGALVIHSGFCDDPGLHAALSAFRGKLIARHVTGVRCYARGGALVFKSAMR